MKCNKYFRIKKIYIPGIIAHLFQFVEKSCSATVSFCCPIVDVITPEKQNVKGPS